MPTHGLRLDAEFATLVLTGLGLSVFMTGNIVSNILFTFLLGMLFFLVGLNMDIGRLKKNFHRGKEMAMGLSLVYLFVPLLAFGLSNMLPTGLSDAFIALAVSTAAIGSPVVWSNIGRGEADTALLVAGMSLLAGFVMLPVLLSHFGRSLSLANPVSNLAVVFLPLAAGLVMQRFDNFVFDDFRHHFSKTALLLLSLVAGVQFQLTYQAVGRTFLVDLWLGLFVMSAFVIGSFSAGYYFSRKAGIMERKARSIGFVSGSREIAVGLFVAFQLSGQAVVFVCLYYFIRQAFLEIASEWFVNGYSPKVEKLRTGFRI